MSDEPKRDPGLNLTRMEGTAFTVGDDVKITVKKARHGKAVLSVEAPNENKINRIEKEELEKHN